MNRFFSPLFPLKSYIGGGGCSGQEENKNNENQLKNWREALFQTSWTRFSSFVSKMFAASFSLQETQVLPFHSFPLLNCSHFFLKRVSDPATHNSANKQCNLHAPLFIYKAQGNYSMSKIFLGKKNHSAKAENKERRCLYL